MQPVQTSVLIVHDDNHVEELFATRTELHADVPLLYGQPSTTGRVVFWTEWLFYSYGKLINRRIGDRIEHSFDTLLPRTWTITLPDGSTMDLPTLLIMAGIKVAFVTLVQERTAPPMPPLLEPATGEEPVENPES